MRGISLPINTLIIIVLAVVVLLSIITLFYMGILTPFETVNSQTALNNACIDLLNFDCQKDTNATWIKDFDADEDGTRDPGTSWIWASSTCGGDIADNMDNLAALCACHFQTVGERNCKKLCRCP